MFLCIFAFVVWFGERERGVSWVICISTKVID